MVLFSRRQLPSPLSYRLTVMAAKKAKKRGRPKKKTSKSATFRLPEELLEALANEAGSQERSQTTLVRRALEAYLASQEESDKSG